MLISSTNPEFFKDFWRLWYHGFSVVRKGICRFNVQSRHLDDQMSWNNSSEGTYSIILFTSGWAEPLLEEIRKNPKTIVQPEVDQIEAMSLEYIGSSGVVPRGGFSWDLRLALMKERENWFN